jgi:glycosyltransferase involved in cell wall biosynthesis
LPAALASHATALGPRGSWRALEPGARVHLFPTRDQLLAAHALPALAARLVHHGCEVTHGAEHRAPVDLLIAWSIGDALAVIDRGVPENARVVAGDFHMLDGRERFADRLRAGWPDPRLEITSCFPSFAHLYVRTGVPLDRIRFRPYPLGPIAERPAHEAAFSGGDHLRDWAMLEAAARSLGARCPAIRVASPPEVRLAHAGGIVPLGRIELSDFVDEIAKASFVITPVRWARDICAGGSVLALALALGKPTVATRVPMALDHLRDGVDAILVDPGDVEAFADAIARIANDHALRARLTEGARRRARACSAEAWADELVSGARPPSDLGTRPWA